MYVTDESGVIGLNFHQSKEVLITDSSNGLNHYEVSEQLECGAKLTSFHLCFSMDNTKKIKCVCWSSTMLGCSHSCHNFVCVNTV